MLTADSSAFFRGIPDIPPIVLIHIIIQAFEKLAVKETHMADTILPSMRIIYFSNQSPEVVNAVIEGLEALGQQVLLLVTTPGTRARPSTEYQRTVANVRRDLDILVTTHMSRLVGMLRPLEPDLIFTTGFTWKLPPELLTLPRLGSVNAHPSLHSWKMWKDRLVYLDYLSCSATLFRLTGQNEYRMNLETMLQHRNEPVREMARAVVMSSGIAV